MGAPDPLSPHRRRTQAEQAVEDIALRSELICQEVIAQKRAKGGHSESYLHGFQDGFTSAVQGIVKSLQEGQPQ